MTFTGPPGVGKTRFALHVARSLSGKFDGGAAWVELASVLDRDGMIEAIASSMPGSAAATDLGTLRQTIGSRHLLLVLDNCEHLISDCADLSHALLQWCPGLSVLATSQEPLGIDGEHTWQVPALALPTDGSKGDKMADSELLFYERATAVDRDFADEPGAGNHVAEICRRLDGNPLAIELAAAAVAVLPVADIAARLVDPFSVLIWGRRSARPRHRSLEAALDWSWNLLAPREQLLLRRLSVFADGFGFDTAARMWAIAEGEPDGRTDGDLLRLLARLVERSLVQSDPALWGRRYRLSGLVRAYAWRRLAQAGAGEVELAAAAGMQALSELAQAGNAAFFGADHDAWDARLQAESRNFTSILETAEQAGWDEHRLEVAASLTMFWWAQRAIDDGRTWLERAVAASASAGVAPALRARLLWGAALMSLVSGETVAAGPWLEEGLQLTGSAPDAGLRSRMLLLLGELGMAGNDADQAVTHLDEGLTLARQAGDTWSVGQILTMQGWIWLRRDDHRAVAALEEAVAITASGNDRKTRTAALNGLAFLRIRLGDLAAADAELNDSIAAAGDMAALEGLPVALTLKGWIAITSGRTAEARQLLEAALGRARALDSPAHVGLALSLMASLELIEGNAVEAGHLYEEAQGLYPGGLESWMLVNGLAEAAEAAGQADISRDLTERALALARASGDNRGVARILYSMGKRFRADGDYKRAAAAHHEALVLRSQIENWAGVAESLEAVAGVAAMNEKWTHAVRTFASALAMREAGGYPRFPTEQAGYDSDLALVRANLDPTEFDIAWEEGLSRSRSAAVSYATRGRGRHSKVGSTGPASLTKTELEVAYLVAEGFTNREVGERLYISARTVQVHLSHIFDKLGFSSRIELAKAVANWDPPPE